MAKRRKDYNDVIIRHKPAPPCLLHPTSSKNVEQKSSSGVESPNVKSVTRKSTRVVTRPGTEADKAHTQSPCSVKQLQDQFLSECQEGDAIAQPLLDAENEFVKDLDRVINHKDLLNMKKRQLLHKRWVERVWQPLQLSVEQRLKHHRHDRAEPMKMTPTEHVNNIAKVSNAPLKDRQFVRQCSKMKEKRADLQNQTGYVDGCQQVSAEEPSRNRRDLHRSSRSLGPAYMATEDGRCYRPGCWSAVDLSHSSSVKP